MSDRSLLECWSLDFDDVGFVEGFNLGGRIWVAFQLRFFRTHGRFPSREDDLCPEGLQYLGQQLDLTVPEISQFRFRHVNARRHRVAILRYLGVRGATDRERFAAFAMIAMRFCPRIRSLHRQRIYCADPSRDHGVLEPVLKRGHRAVNFNLIAEQWDRICQFYVAFPTGHTTASAALQRLNRFQPSNRFYAANRELGRVLKTEFILQYMSEPQLRARVRRGLLKVEQLHALARAVYYGQRGRISAREVYDQMKTCSCLTLILACIICWQAREISRMTATRDFPFDHDLLRHVSPIEWKNVILYGEIKIDPAKLRMQGR